jgi:DNA modification methylase
VDYDPADNAAKSYDAAIEALRERLLSFRREIVVDSTLYLGDCKLLLPLLPLVDAIVTDPPYGIDYGRAGGFSASHGWGQWREKVTWDAERPERAIFDLMLRQSKEQIIWGGNYFTDYLPPTMQWLVWDKGQRDFSLADCEFAWSSQERAARVFNFARGKANQDGKEHPTQKPVELMKWCLSLLPKAKVILDPFMGAGSTGVAAARMGRKFIGIEMDEGYFNAACLRIAGAYAQPDLLVEAEAKAEQLDMLLGSAS